MCVKKIIIVLILTLFCFGCGKADKNVTINIYDNRTNKEEIKEKQKDEVDTKQKEIEQSKEQNNVDIKETQVIESKTQEQENTKTSKIKEKYNQAKKLV